MRLESGVTQEDAYQWLREQVEALLPPGEPPADLETNLQQLAEAMAVIAAASVPDDVEPRFP